MDSALELVEAKLSEIFSELGSRPASLHEAMRYAVGSGGKRVRPLLCIAAAEAVGGSREDAVYPACAVEILHNYTLVHDDLPAMDGDRLRRGKPTLWVKYGQANAILAGDALLSLAFQVAVKSPRNAAQIVSVLARAGVGVVQGQVEDLAIGSDGAVSAADADFIYRHKTADLFAAAVLSGALAAGAGESELAALEEYALNLGLAFQYVDDLLDGDGAYSKERTAELAESCTAAALAALEKLPGDTSRLSEIADALARRKV